VTRSNEPPRSSPGALGGLLLRLRLVDGVARLGVVLVTLTTAGFALAYTPRALDRLDDRATRNSSLSYADREIAGGNSILVDQLAAYQARGLIPPDDTYRVVTGAGLKEKTDLTLPFVDSWFRYFLMPRRPSGSARWVICYGCDTHVLGGRWIESWHDDEGISIGRLPS
jgi:hypothetical protein